MSNNLSGQILVRSGQRHKFYAVLYILYMLTMINIIIDNMYRVCQKKQPFLINPDLVQIVLKFNKTQGIYIKTLGDYVTIQFDIL